MADSTTRITLDEYLGTSSPDGDREFVDGELVERPISSKSHSRLQRRLIEVFYELAKRHPFSAFPELRVRVNEDRVRIPDVVIYAGAEPDEEVPTTPPLIAVEILSPDDRMQQLMEKLREYRAWGVAHIWVIDPQFRTMAEFGSSGLLDITACRLPEYNLEVTFAGLFPEPVLNRFGECSLSLTLSGDPGEINAAATEPQASEAVKKPPAQPLAQRV